MTVPPRPRALGYVRVSSYLGRDRGEALTEPMQLEKIQQWCAVADLDLVEVLRDVDRSGKGFSVLIIVAAGGQPPLTFVLRPRARRHVCVPSRLNRSQPGAHRADAPGSRCW